MRPWFLDFETFWSNDYSLRSLTPPEYIMDPRFEAIGCAAVDPGGHRFWVDGPELPRFFTTIDWDNAFAVSHNALFDMLILALRYGHRPKMYGDTLSMARNWIGHKTGSVSLASCAKFYGLPPKGDAVLQTKGLNFAAIRANPALHKDFADYAIHDAHLCLETFARMMADGFPPGELEVIDMVIRMATAPQFEIDRMLLAEHLAETRSRKQQLLDQAGIAKDNLSSVMSDKQLAVKLLFLGVDPIPMKVSKTTGKEAYAFAKTDKEFTELLNHPEPLVQALVACRLGHKSTLEESRTERLLTISNLVDKMPVPLKYSGAHTHRFSGDWKINLQNLPTGSKLRRALRAPEGKAVVSIDASQIEARLNASLAGQHDLVADFESGVDVYAQSAEELYGYPVSKRSEPKERFVGKTSILSLGYGSSWPVFQSMCRVKGDVQLTDSEAAKTVAHYRARYRKIVENWDRGRNMLMAISMGLRQQWGPLVIEKYAIRLPNGNSLNYPNLRQIYAKDKLVWVFERGNQPHFIYGAKLVENVIQALAFVHIMEVARRVNKMTHGLLVPGHQIHDELIYVVDNNIASMVKHLVTDEMSKSPAWMPAAPLAAEGHIGDDYGTLKG